jgi:hypothetical protein
LDDFSVLLVNKHLNGLVGVPYTLEEVSLSGTELYHSMAKEKTQWTGAGDDWLDESEFPRDHAENVITLEAQRIRMFRFTLQPIKPIRPPTEEKVTE